MLDRRRKGGLGRLISAMSDNPGQTVTTYAGSVGVSNRQIQKWKNKISVLKIERGLECRWFSNTEKPDEPVVEYEGKNGVERLFLRSFAGWAGGEA